jgi:hypothetical protein
MTLVKGRARATEYTLCNHTLSRVYQSCSDLEISKQQTASNEHFRQAP